MPLASNAARKPTPTVKQDLGNLLLALIPSFLQPYFGRRRDFVPERSGNFAALDGLRGCACLLVFNFHFLFSYTHNTSIGWGFAEENWGLHQLPIIHLLFSGHVMVAIFFVISGYVLSYKNLKLFRNSLWDQAFHALASSTLRRGIRLYIPAFVDVCLITIAVRLGCYNYSTWVRDKGNIIVGVDEQHPFIFPTLRAQIWDAYLTMVHLLDPWNWTLFYNHYNPHLWTIPVEFRCSVVLFLTLLCTSRLRSRYRALTVSCLTFYCMRWGRWDVVLFLSGMLLAETDLTCGLWEAPRVPENHTNGATDKDDYSEMPILPTYLRTTAKQQSATTTRRAPWLYIFVVGLYFASCPNSAPAMTPGYKYLSTYIPETYPEPQRFLQSIGAVIIVCCINHSSPLQRTFELPLAQYLGRISFAFYVVHGPILHSLGYSIMPSIWAYTGKETNSQFCTGLFLGYIICLGVSVWAGDLFWRAVDIPTVRFSKWIENRIT